MRVIVHGGAGGAPEDPDERRSALDEAAATGATAEAVTDAAVGAVRTLEDDDRFNAGVGSTVQSDGIARTDAGLMTDDREVGAVAGMPGVAHAGAVARVVKEETPHVLMVGVHAVDLAAAFDVETQVDLETEATRDRWGRQAAPPAGDLAAQLRWVREAFDGLDADPGRSADPREGTDHDTVGAVAREGDRLATCTSTGGRWNALAGRVGDVPQVGSGFYCSRAGGASATGAGEDIARVTLARRAVDHLELGRSAEAAAELAIEEFVDLTGSTAGVIVQRNDGDCGSASNSDLMQTSVAGE